MTMDEVVIAAENGEIGPGLYALLRAAASENPG